MASDSVDQYRERLAEIKKKIEHAQEMVRKRFSDSGGYEPVADLLDQIEWLVDDALSWYFGSTA